MSGRRLAVCLLLLLGVTGPLAARSEAAPTTKTRISFEGRPVDVFLPAGRPRALVMLLHGYKLTSVDIEKTSQLIDPGAHQGWVIVVPNGVKGSWNAGLCCGTAMREGVDDVSYLTDLVTSIRAQRHLAGNAPTVMGGFSDGAMMAEEMLCRKPGLIDGAFLMAGGLQDPGCSAAHARAIVEIAGRSDHTVPAAGLAHSNYLDTRLLPEQATRSAAEKGRRCRATTVEVTKPVGKGYTVVTDVCAGETYTSLTEVGGHTWLHGTQGTRSATTPLILGMVRSLEPA